MSIPVTQTRALHTGRASGQTRCGHIACRAQCATGSRSSVVRPASPPLPPDADAASKAPPCAGLSFLRDVIGEDCDEKPLNEWPTSFPPCASHVTTAGGAMQDRRLLPPACARQPAAADCESRRPAMLTVSHFLSIPAPPAPQTPTPPPPAPTPITPPPPIQDPPSPAPIAPPPPPIEDPPPAGVPDVPVHTPPAGMAPPC